MEFIFPNFYKKENFRVKYESPSQFFRPRFWIQIPFKYNFLRNDKDYIDSLFKSVRKAVTALLPERFGMMDKQFSAIFDSADTESALNLFPFIFNYFVGGVSVNRSRIDIGSATITLNFYKKQDIFYDFMKRIFNQILFPVCPVRIYMQGRFVPDMICVFTGFITDVNYEEGTMFKTITVSANDAAKLLILSPININPGIVDRRTFTSFAYPQGKEAGVNILIRIFSEVFTNLSYPAILRLLILGANALSPEERRTREGLVLNFDGIYNITERKLDSKEYTGTSSEQKSTFSLNRYSFRPALALRPSLIIWGPKFIPSRNLDTTTNEVFNSEVISRWELIRKKTEDVFFDFYATATGDFHAHPMRFDPPFMHYDLFDVTGKPKQFKWREKLNIPPMSFILMDDEILSLNFRFNDSGFITAYDYIGEIPFTQGFEGTSLSIFGVANAPRRLIERMGLRYRRERNPLVNKIGSFGVSTLVSIESVQREFLQWLKDNPEASNEQKLQKERESIAKLEEAEKAKKAFRQNQVDLNILARERMNLINGSQYTGTATLILRPELDVAKPCYVPNRKEIFYIDAITHNISVGSTATTTVSMAYGRPPTESFSFYEYLRKLHSFKNLKMLSAEQNKKELERHDKVKQ